MKSTSKLDLEASRQAIDHAIGVKAQIVLESAALPDMTINGFLLSGDEKALLMEVTGRLPVDTARLVGAPCEAQIYGDLQYRFSTTITAAPQWGESRSLAVARPRTLHRIERRRFKRASLAPSSQVTIEWKRAGLTHRHTAALLNISTDGLACRVDGATAASIQRQGSLRAVFKLPGQDRLFSIGAVVQNKTPASEGCMILGLQFSRAAHDGDHRAALSQALSKTTTHVAASEVCA